MGKLPPARAAPNRLLPATIVDAANERALHGASPLENHTLDPGGFEGDAVWVKLSEEDISGLPVFDEERVFETEMVFVLDCEPNGDKEVGATDGVDDADCEAVVDLVGSNVGLIVLDFVVDDELLRVAAGEHVGLEDSEGPAQLGGWYGSMQMHLDVRFESVSRAHTPWSLQSAVQGMKTSQFDHETPASERPPAIMSALS